MHRLALLLSTALTAQWPSWYTVAIPDTQHYSYDQGRMLHFWLACVSVHGWGAPPAYVVQVGDLTEHAVDQEFRNSLSAMALLSPIPAGICIGNHDYDAGQKCTPQGEPYPCTSQFRRWVGPENRFDLVSTPDGAVAFLLLEYMPSDAALRQAHEFLLAHPTAPAVLVTHYWLDIDGTRSRIGARLDGAGDNSPTEAWAKLVESSPQVFLVLCGHVSGEARRSDISMAGRQVVQLLANYQSDPDGGQGFVRLVGFGGRQIHVLTHSSSYLGLPPNRFGHFIETFDGVAAIRAELLAHPRETLRPAADTFVADTWGGIGERGNWEWLWCSGGGHDHSVGLVRFDVPAGPVSRALLTVTAEGYQTSGDGFTLHRMLVPWTEASTWTGFGGLVAGRDYDAAPLLSSGPLSAGTHVFDVTDAVRSGAPLGWAFVGVGSTCGFRSREWYEPMEQPRLEVMR